MREIKEQPFNPTVSDTYVADISEGTIAIRSGFNVSGVKGTEVNVFMNTERLSSVPGVREILQVSHPGTESIRNVEGAEDWVNQAVNSAHNTASPGTTQPKVRNCTYFMLCNKRSFPQVLI